MGSLTVGTEVSGPGPVTSQEGCEIG